MFFIMDLKKLNCNLYEYITYKQVSIYLFEGSLTQNMSNLRLAIYLPWEVILSDIVGPMTDPLVSSEIIQETTNQ